MARDRHGDRATECSGLAERLDGAGTYAGAMRAAGLRERQVAELIEDDEINADQRLALSSNLEPARSR